MPQAWQRWGAIALVEIAIGLGLFAIAPMLLNSSQPVLGFAIVVGVPCVWGSSAIYLGWRVIDAVRARSLLIQYDSRYRQLSVLAFLDIPSRLVRPAIVLFEKMQEDQSLESLNLSPLDLLDRPPSRR
ncbi:MAG: hypothetical protein EA001_01290 [Oscillatoriales cyanobacterium]|nr:MAG: hypothetical protein EA001_01290 [Oscillatoriales cyanobacterium]